MTVETFKKNPAKGAAREAEPVAVELAAEPDREYTGRIEAARVTLQFGFALGPKAPQEDVEELPLFGGARQGNLF